MSLPRAPDMLPNDFAAALGHAVSGFGFLEEALKRAIYSLSAQSLGENASERAVQSWIEQMENIADDSLGSLIDRFGGLLRHGRTRGDHDGLVPELRDLRRLRNVLCHASWRPEDEDGLWHPTFINTHGEAYDDAFDVAALEQIRARTLAAARRIVSIMRATGIDGELALRD